MEETFGQPLTGFWTDYSKPRPLGWMLTLPNNRALPLITALTILVTLAAGRSWHLCRLFWHALLRSKTQHRRRQQVLLRNSETAVGATLGLLEERVTSGWRGGSFVKDALLVLFTLGHFVVFLAMGVLVSQIVVGQVVVSKKLDTCGQWFPKRYAEDGILDTETTAVWNELQLNKTINSENYVRSCYPEGGSHGTVGCDRLFLRSIGHVVQGGQELGLGCPFPNQTACLVGEEGVARLESDKVAMAELGMNVKYGKEVSVQRRSTCAVMNSNTFKTKEFLPDEGSDATREYTFFYDVERQENFTLTFNMRNQFSDDYKLIEFYFAPIKPEDIVFSLRPNSSTGMDLSIILLQGFGIKFRSTNDDPWFRAHRKWNYTVPVPEDSQTYQIDAFVNTIACQEQFRFCSSITENCASWQGISRYVTLGNIPDSYETLFGKDGLKQNTKESWDFGLSVLLIENVMQQTALPYSIQQRGQAALQASRYINNGHQMRLNKDQWKLELSYWFMMALARLQVEILDTIDMPLNLDTERATNLWAEEKWRGMLELCGRMKFRRAGYTSLSALGVVLIVVGSGLLLLGSMLGGLLSFVPWVRNWRVVREWRRDDVLTLLEGAKELETPEGREAEVEHATVVMGDDKTRLGNQQGNVQFDPFLVGR